MMDQKILAKFVDRAADRADMIDREPASPKQCWFLAGLIVKGGDETQASEFVLNTSLVLTKRIASGMIDGYLSTRRAA
jgi:hypothetical protein